MFSWYPNVRESFADPKDALPDLDALISEIRDPQRTSPEVYTRIRSLAQTLSGLDPATPAYTETKNALTEAKKALPAITLSGVSALVHHKNGKTATSRPPAEELSGPGKCWTRKLVKHSGLVQVDFDHCPENADMGAIRAALSADPHVVFHCVSPSGGVKAAVRVEGFTPANHSANYKAVFAHYSRYGKPDKAVSDPGRLLYMPCDPTIWVEDMLQPAIPFVAADSLDDVFEDLDAASPRPYRADRMSPCPHTTIAEVGSMLQVLAKEKGEWVRGGGKEAYDWWNKMISAVFSQVGKDVGVALLKAHFPEKKRGEYAEKYEAGFTLTDVSFLRREVAQYAAEPVMDTRMEIMQPDETSGVTFNSFARTVMTHLAEKRVLFRVGSKPCVVDVKNGVGTRTDAGPHVINNVIEEHMRVMGVKNLGRGKTEARVVGVSKQVCERIAGDSRLVGLLPAAAVFSHVPVIRCGGEILGPGWHDVGGGTYVVCSADAPDKIGRMPLDEAIATVKHAVSCHNFDSPQDRLRTIGAIIGSTMLSCGILRGLPLTIYCGSGSQVGKGAAVKMMVWAANEIHHVYAAKNERGGVGGTEETIAQAFLSFRRFINFDNVTREFRSDTLEAATSVNANEVDLRGFGRASTAVDVSRRVITMTSNGVNITKDLCNRAVVVSLSASPSLNQHMSAMDRDEARERLSTAVLTIIHDYAKRGCPRDTKAKNLTPHSFREWRDTMQHILEHYFDADGDFLVGMGAATTTLSDPLTSWLRSVILAISRDEGERRNALRAAGFVEYGTAVAGIPLPYEYRGVKDKGVLRAVGGAFKRVFGERDEAFISGVRLRRQRNRGADVFEYYVGEDPEGGFIPFDQQTNEESDF